MAPSRALLHIRRLTSAYLRISPSTLCHPRSLQPHQSPCRKALQSGPTMRNFPAFPCARAYSTPSATSPEPPDYLNELELHIFNKVKAELEPVKLEVQDISGGCGSMYALEIESPKFKGLPVIKQHKMVNEVLKEEIKGWHGVQLRTKAA